MHRLGFRARDITVPLGIGREDAPRSHAQSAYVGLEVVKVVALAMTGVLLLGS